MAWLTRLWQKLMNYTSKLFSEQPTAFTFRRKHWAFMKPTFIKKLLSPV